MSATPEALSRERWSSHRGFLAAAIGSAVGLGNIWRFPYVAGENGGGTFLIPYAVAILACGLPLMMFELAAGREYRLGVFGTIQAIAPRYRFIGGAIGAIGLIIVSYYLVVTGWTLGYLIYTPLGMDVSFTDFSDSWGPLVFFLVSAGITVSIVLLGINRGIEATSKMLLPLLAAIVVIMAAYGMTLPGRAAALDFLFQFRPRELLEPLVWANAFGQAFFSLGVGMGVLVTYGSYLDRRGDIPGLARVVVGADTLIALFSGLIIFPMVFSFGYSPEAGAQLAFETLPRVFEQMRLGTLLGSVFYLLLFLAATTSAVSILQMVVAVVADRMTWSHRRSTWALLAPLLLLGTASALSYSPMHLTIFGRPVLDALDGTVGTFGLLVAGLLTSVALFWLGRPQRLVVQVAENPNAWVGRSGLFLGRYLLPLALIGTLIALAVSEL